VAAFLSPYRCEDGMFACSLGIRFGPKRDDGGALGHDVDAPNVPFPRCGGSSRLTTNRGGLGGRARPLLGPKAELVAPRGFPLAYHGLGVPIVTR
jgi:hypothetical protein